MKKLLAIAVAAMMVFAMAGAVMAEEVPEGYTQTKVFDGTYGFGDAEITAYTNDDQSAFYLTWEAFDEDQILEGTVEDGIVDVAYDLTGFMAGDAQLIWDDAVSSENPWEAIGGEAVAAPEGESGEGESEGAESGESGGDSKGDEQLVELQNEEDGSALEPIVTTSFSGTVLAYPRYATVVNADVTEAIVDDVAWHNGAIYFEAGEWNVAADITMNTTADGSDTNDFSGLGAAVLAEGKGTIVNITGATIETTGVAKLALFTDNGALAIVKNSTLISNSGTIYEGYMSTADQTTMVAPPWVLGLGGAKTNARTTNIMGDYSTAAYIDSAFVAGGWGALSTDSGTNMHMVVVNTTVDVEDSGYGAYTIGNSTEDYYGVTENVSTYVNIMTGGNATYQSYTGGQEIEVVQYNGEQDEYGHGAGGEVVATVKSDSVGEGEIVYSVLNSENFGFMCHANGMDGMNIVNILDGTTVNSEDATFLVKKINSIFNVDNAVLNPANGVILQIIDNDDDYVGLDMETRWGTDDGYGHFYGIHMPNFNSTFHEEDGYANEFAVNETAVEENWTSELNITNTTVDGDVWNASGYVGSNPATTLTVNLGEGANLTGIISAGAFSHTTKDAKVNDGDWSEASALGHVTDIVNSNGKNIVNVALSDDAVWTVESDSVIDTLTIDGDAQVVIPAGVTLTVGGVEYTDTTLAAGYDLAEAA